MVLGELLEGMIQVLDVAIRTLILPLELADATLHLASAEEEPTLPPWMAGLGADQRQALIDALVAVAASDGCLSRADLRVITTSIIAPRASVNEAIRRAVQNVESVSSTEDALVIFRQLPTRVRQPEALRFALDASAAILSLGDGARRALVPRFAEALGLGPADAEQALADNIVFVRPPPPPTTPYR